VLGEQPLGGGDQPLTELGDIGLCKQAGHEGEMAAGTCYLCDGFTVYSLRRKGRAP